MRKQGSDLLDTAIVLPSNTNGIVQEICLNCPSVKEETLKFQHIKRKMCFRSVT